ncbi:MAG: DEAD/DEAH box helicase family protein, partial [Fibrella sp.]|nr:DEAD/DEAH box helicase family protein [Armatimonadota bacterium]
MAFKKTIPLPPVPDSPEQILLDLPRRKIPGVLLHQGEIIKTYVSQAVDTPDVALQLPTGSGKTLVGLLIAEWRRRKFRERVLFLCPNKQLVNQVVEQANDLYGLTVHGFTGKSSGFDPVAKAEYGGAERLGVTTYSALFNTNPFFNNPDLIVVDDAHAAENYIAKLWTFVIERRNPEHQAIHAAVASIIRALLSSSDYSRLIGAQEGVNYTGWVDKVPTPYFAKIHDELISVIDTYVTAIDLRYTWKMIRDHLFACHLYLTPDEIMIRPLIPPTWEHKPFADAKQRIYMSATLGAGGDLERLTGRKSVMR